MSLDNYIDSKGCKKCGDVECGTCKHCGGKIVSGIACVSCGSKDELSGYWYNGVNHI